MTLLCHQRHFGTWAAQESVCLPESVGGVELDDHYLCGWEVRRSEKYRKATIWPHLRWYCRCCCSPGATASLRHVTTDLQGWFNSVFLCADTQVNPPATWSATAADWRWLTENQWSAFMGCTHTEKPNARSPLQAPCWGCRDVKSALVPPASLRQPCASACPLSDSLTFSAAATHRSERTGRAREGIRDGEWSIKEAAEEGEYMLWGWWNDSWLEQKIASESW